PADAPVWPGSWPRHSSEMIRADLERAGVPYVDAAGRYRDFHALRHRFATELARANVPVKAAQALMRHSTSRLTRATYSHAHPHRVEGAVDRLPPLPTAGPDRTEAAAARATGTGGRISNLVSHHFPTGGDASGRFGAGTGGSTPGEGGERNPLDC